jgi:hypothetical protein
MEFSRQPRSNRVILSNVWPESGPGTGNGPEAPSPFPETNFLASRLNAGWSVP